MQIPGLGFPIRTIFAVGRNYADHAKELNNPIPSVPLIFLKPLSAVSFSPATISLGKFSQEVHYEGEIVVAIGSHGKNVSEAQASDLVAGYGVGIDVTARDLQTQAKKAGEPWAVAKGQDGFAPLSSFVPRAAIDDSQLQVQLWLNQQLRQKGSADQMLFSIPKLIAYLSTTFTLNRGDLIFTGTPKGVGKLAPGDQLKVSLGANTCTLEASVTQ